MKVLILSDVHGDIKTLSKIIDLNSDVDLKIYLGDFQIPREEQKKLTYNFDHVVQGNCDYPEISETLKFIEANGVKIFITHGHHYSSLQSKIDFDKLFEKAKEMGADLILHGHDHIAAKESRNEIVRFNPGSTSYPYNSNSGTYGILEIENGKINSLEHIKI